MENWILWAVLAMIFAGVTAVIAKLGMSPNGDPVDEPQADAEASADMPMTPQEQILARVANGEITAEIGAQLIAAL